MALDACVVLADVCDSGNHYGVIWLIIWEQKGVLEKEIC